MPILTVRDLDIYYEITGAGQPLLLLHGLGSCTQDWKRQVAFFSQHYQVITFDLRGHGKSGKPAGPYSISLFAEDTAELLKALGIAGAHVVGISLGGMIAFQLAVSYPELVNSLVIVNSGPAVPADTFKQRIPLYLRLVMIHLLGLRKMAEKLGKHLFPKPEQTKLRQDFVERLAQNNKHTYLAALKAIFAGWSVADQLGDIQCPTLVLAAEQDYTPVALKEAYAAAIPKAELVVIADSRHALPLERPEAFNETLGAFLSRHSGELEGQAVANAPLPSSQAAQLHSL